MATPHAPALAKVVRAILHILPTEFVRNRLNGPRQLLALLLTQVHSGMNRIGMRATRLCAMQHLSGFLQWSSDHTPSTSAICRGIRKLSPSMFEEVVEHGLAQVAAAYGPRLLIHSRRLVAIDGVRVNTRRTSILARWLGLPRQGDDRKAHQPQALVVSARCVISGVTLAEEIVKHKGSERACARRMIGRLATMGPMVVVLDRGFPARDLIEQLINHQIDFVVRMCGGKRTWRELRGCDTGPAHDSMIDMRLRDASGRYATRSLRCVLSRTIARGRPRCNRTPQRTLLLTNLTGRYWSTGRIIALYRRRWDIETSFREDKRLLGTTRSHATTRNGFTVELLALRIYRILMALIMALLAASAGVTRWDDPRAPRLNTPQIILAAWWLLIMAAKKTTSGHDPLLWALREILRDAEKRRPYRRFVRECKGVEGAWKKKSERRGR